MADTTGKRWFQQQQPPSDGASSVIFYPKLVCRAALSTRSSQSNGGESAALASMWSLLFDDEVLDLVSFHRMYSIMQLVEDLLYLQLSRPLLFQCKTPRLFSLPLIVYNSSFVAICVHCFLQAERGAIQ